MSVKSTVASMRSSCGLLVLDRLDEADHRVGVGFFLVEEGDRGRTGHREQPSAGDERCAVLVLCYRVPLLLSAASP